MKPDCRVWQFSTRSRVCTTKSQVCKCADLSYKNHKCADLVDKYIGNIFPRQANSFEHVDILCGLGTTLYNLPPCGAVNTISGNLGLQIFKNFLTRCQPWWHLVRFSPIPKCAWEFSRKFLRCALTKLGLKCTISKHCSTMMLKCFVDNLGKFQRLNNYINLIYSDCNIRYNIRKLFNNKNTWCTVSTILVIDVK